MVKDEVVNVLSTLLHSRGEDEELRIAAADGLGYAGFSKARKALLEIIEDESEGLALRASAIRALGHTVYTSKS